MPAHEEIAPYLQRLAELPFVRGTPTATGGTGNTPVEVRLNTPSGKVRLPVDLKRTPITRELAARLASRDTGALVLAPTVGSQMGEVLRKAQVCFMDLAGNCYLQLEGGRYIAVIKGQKGVTKTTVQKGMRAPAYRALFALLAEPELAGVSIRRLAERAAVSRQAAIDIRARLVEMGILFKRKAGYGWIPGRTAEAMDLLVMGYATTLRPALLVGRYRGRDPDPAKLEADIVDRLGDACEFKFGGGAAADRMLHHYHGPRTVLHVQQPPADLPKRLGVIADRQGPLHVLTVPGPVAMQGATPDTAHPLLVYCELLVEGDDRARESAAMVADRFLGEERFG